MALNEIILAWHLAANIIHTFHFLAKKISLSPCVSHLAASPSISLAVSIVSAHRTV